MDTATLVAANLPQFCPDTHHYLLPDGRHVLVTVASLDVPATLNALGIRVPIARSHLPRGAQIFLCDESAAILDADGNPANGMTPLGWFDVDTHEAALAALLAPETPTDQPDTDEEVPA